MKSRRSFLQLANQSSDETITEQAQPVELSNPFPYIQDSYYSNSQYANQKDCSLDESHHMANMLKLEENSILSRVFPGPLEKGSALALIYLLPQTNSDFVRKVLIFDEYSNLIAAQFFHPSQSKDQGYLPYIYFHPVPTFASGKINLVLERLVAGQIKVFYQGLQHPPFEAPALFDPLPTHLKSRFIGSHKGKVYSSAQKISDENKSQASGLKTATCHEPACSLILYPTVMLNEIKQDDFSIQIRSKYPDTSQSQDYIRSAIITDPVGRLLALTERSFQTSGTLPQFPLLSIYETQQKYGSNNVNGNFRTAPFVDAYLEHNTLGLFHKRVWIR